MECKEVWSGRGDFNLLYVLFKIVIHPKYCGPYHICSGSLITYDTVLTASHCVRNPDNLYYVGVGKIDNSFTIRPSGTLKFDYGQTRKVEFIYSHKNFTYSNQENDIALLKCYEPFNNTLDVPLITLPENEKKGDLAEHYKYCYTGGWGRINAQNMRVYSKEFKNWTILNVPESSTKVIYTVMPLISNRQCRRIWHIDSRITFSDVTDNQICTNYYPGRKSSCKGDSGGPIICGSVQYGIISSSYSCGKARIGVNVHTRVDKYIKWIKETTELILNISRMNRKTRKIVKVLDTEYYDILQNTSSSVQITIPLILVFVFNYALICLFK